MNYPDLTLEELIELTPNNMTLGKTVFTDPQRKYSVLHVAWVLGDYRSEINTSDPNVIAYMNDATSNDAAFYGATPREAIMECLVYFKILK